jgi:hypothetical protein
MFRPKQARASVVKNQKPQKFLRRIDLISFVSGHDHALPYASGQSWNQRPGESRLLVPVNC